MRGRLLAAALAAAVLGGCGDDDGGGPAATPAAVTPVPSGAAAPSPTEQPHGEPSATPTATATPAGEGGDERPIRVPVRVTVSERRVRASRAAVPAFLNLRFRVTNRVGRDLRVVVVRSGASGGTVGRATVPAGGTRPIDVDGLRPGSLEVLSPDLDPDNTAIVRVQAGG